MKLKILFFGVLFAIVSMLSPNLVLAQLGDGGCSNEEIYTAIGCVPISTQTGLFVYLVSWAMGLAGGIAFLLVVYAGFQIMTSTGNPDKLKAGKELMTSAIMGIVLLIFSALILRVIGVDLLAIPGL